MPDNPAIWYGTDLTRDDAWSLELPAEALAEIESALPALRDLATVRRESLQMPQLAESLAAVRQDVVWGRGFVRMRGLPVTRYSMREAATAFWCIGLHLGVPVSQNAAGHLLGHVTDLGRDPRDPTTRIYTTNRFQPFHTDSCDVVALLSLATAASGGASSLVSSVTIHEEMRRTRPDLVRVLERPFCVDRKGEVPAGRGAYYEMPVFHHHRGRLLTTYARDFIEAAQRHPDVPRLTTAQIEALDEMDRLAARPDLRLDMELAPGDLQIVHNHQILHARSGYRDDDQHRRHLLRLWLSTPDGWELPPIFAERYGPIVPGRPRGGIRVRGATLHVPLTPS